MGTIYNRDDLNANLAINFIPANIGDMIVIDMIIISWSV